LFWVVYYQDILKSNAIDSVIKNEYLSGGAGELPPNECWPRLYVSDADFARAERIVQEELHRKPDDTPPWTCPQCGEENEGQFAVCWNCGSPNDGGGPGASDR
jgi:hypothetical protein